MTLVTKPFTSWLYIKSNTLKVKPFIWDSGEPQGSLGHMQALCKCNKHHHCHHHQPVRHVANGDHGVCQSI